ncbi:MAG TPA: hypothetical protein VII94_03915 [Candidatus Saccharimonadales bacterium]
MIPEKGQQVSCILRSSLIVEGIVQEWSDAQVVLKALDGQNIIILHRPVDDIILTKVVLSEELQEIPEEKPREKPVEIQKLIRNKLQEVQDSTDDLELQKKSAAELRLLVKEQEQQIISNRKKEYFGNSSKSTHYSSPFLPKKK